MGVTIRRVTVAAPNDGTTLLDTEVGPSAVDLLAVSMAGKQMEFLLGRGRLLYWSSDWAAAVQLAAKAVGSASDSREAREALLAAGQLTASILLHAKPAVRSLAKQLRGAGYATGADCKQCLQKTPEQEQEMIQQLATAYRRTLSSLAVSVAGGAGPVQVSAARHADSSSS